MAGFESFLVRLSLEVIRDYDFSVPLHRWLATYFRENKKLGSRDRRGIRELVYSYFRLGKCIPDAEELFRLQTALYLTQPAQSNFIQEVLQDSTFASVPGMELEMRVKYVSEQIAGFHTKGLFPFHEPLSSGIDRLQLELSLLQQPLVWIRIRKEFIEQVRAELSEKGIQPVRMYAPGMLGLPQAVHLDKLKTFAAGYFEIQDLSSQLTAALYQPKPGELWWDCCAASGGKSLLLLDAEPALNLTVSDIRSSSLQNLSERFKRNHYRVGTLFTADLTKEELPQLDNRLFDGVLVDAPCTGSGTWGRTPEMISSFQSSELIAMNQLQRTILAASGKHVKPGGALIYMTCSVFAAENESVVNSLIEQGSFQLEEMKVIQGVKQQADTLFAARLIKN